MRKPVPESFIMVPGAGFTVKDSDILVFLGKELDLSKIRKLK